MVMVFATPYDTRLRDGDESPCFQPGSWLLAALIAALLANTGNTSNNSAKNNITYDLMSKRPLIDTDAVGTPSSSRKIAASSQNIQLRKYPSDLCIWAEESTTCSSIGLSPHYPDHMYVHTYTCLMQKLRLVFRKEAKHRKGIIELFLQGLCPNKKKKMSLQEERLVG